MNISRRRVLMGGGLLAAALHLPVRAFTQGKGDVAIIRMTSDADGSVVGFDPVGLLVRPGQTIRWECVANFHTTTAYHPDNDQHSLRVPERSKPWSSDLLMPGQSFEVTLTVEGVYDYFCAPHEMAGMVGRIVVGKAGGPGTLPFDYFSADPAKRDWREVPKIARDAFPAVAEIVRAGSVRRAASGHSGH